jgi:pyrimidine-specific ribonucleoside hydrolase
MRRSSLRRIPSAAAAALAAGLALSGCGAGGDQPVAGDASSAPLPVVVDTDAGLDDAIALLYLASSPDVDVRAVTVTGTGLAHCFPGALNVVGLLEATGRPDVPVACGREKPRGAGDELHAFPRDWRTGADGRYGNTWPIGQGTVDDRSAAELLVDTVAASESPVTLVTLGPLTNVADALALDEDVAAGLEKVVAMGGAFEVSGNTADADTPPQRNVAEWNVYADPSAARDVVRAGLPLTFVPLDATNEVPLDAFMLRAAGQAPPSDALRLTNALLTEMQWLIDEGDYYLWDPLAAVLALRPELGTATEAKVDVVTDGPESGRTATADGGTAANYVSSADGDAAKTALLEGLSGGPVPPVSDEPDLVFDAATCTTDRADLGAGPRIVQLDAGDASRFVAIGTLDPGRDEADIAAALAHPTEQGPEWFHYGAALGGADGAGATLSLVDLAPGEYTAVCVQGEEDVAMELLGTTTLTVTP